LVFSNSFVESCRHFKADRVLSSACKPVLEHIVLHRTPARYEHHHGIRTNWRGFSSTHRSTNRSVPSGFF
jgi:hypothetical protein